MLTKAQKRALLKPDTPGLINTSGVSVYIYNNERKQPTVWAEEAMEAVMEGVIITSTSSDPHIRDQAMAYQAQIRQHVFNALVPIFARCITSEQVAAEKRR